MIMGTLIPAVISEAFSKADFMLQNPYIPTKYLWMFAAFVFFSIIFKIALHIAIFIISRVVSKTKTKVDDQLLDRLKEPMSYILIILALKLALLPIDITTKIGKFVSGATETLLIIFIIYCIMVIYDTVIESLGKKISKKTKTTLDDELIPLFHKIGQVIIWIIGGIVVFKSWGFEVGPILASLGIAGLAVGLALQDTLKNIFGGVSLILDKNFAIGDSIKLDTGESGVVYDIGLRSTKIQTWDNEILIVPNGVLANLKLINYANPNNIRVVVNFGVAYGSDVKKVKKIVMDTVKKMKILKDPEPIIRFEQMADFSLNFTVKFWIDGYNNMTKMKSEATEAIYNALNKAKIDIPFPTHTIYIKK